MSSKYDLDSLKKLNKQELNDETDMAQELLFQLCIIQRQILTQIEVGTSRDWMHGYLNEYLSEQEKLMKALEEMRAELPKVTEELVKQAGKMSEQYSLLTKKTEFYRTRIKDRQLKFIVISQSVLLVLSAIFQLLVK